MSIPSWIYFCDCHFFIFDEKFSICSFVANFVFLAGSIHESPGSDLLEGAKEIADGVEILPTPGHTPGCQSVVVETQEGKAIIAGFCSIDANFYPTEEVKKRMEVIPPTQHSNLMQAYASALEVKKNADIILPLHEAGVAKRKVIP